MPAVQAIARIEEISAGYEGTGSAVAQRGPGLQIVILQPGTGPSAPVAETQVIDVHAQGDTTEPVKHAGGVPGVSPSLAGPQRSAKPLISQQE
jgi:hypothetical protein